MPLPTVKEQPINSTFFHATHPKTQKTILCIYNALQLKTIIWYSFNPDNMPIARQRNLAANLIIDYKEGIYTIKTRLCPCFGTESLDNLKDPTTYLLSECGLNKLSPKDHKILSDQSVKNGKHDLSVLPKLSLDELEKTTLNNEESKCEDFLASFHRI